MNEHFVYITPVKGSNGQISWTMDYDGHKGFGPSDYPAIALQKGTGNHNITFTIKDANGITFSKDPIWVEVAGKPAKSPSKSGVNAQILVSPHNGTQLLIVDKNSGNPVTLSYQLNFEGAPALDPIIENGGGGPPGFQTFYYYAGAALLVALVAALLLRNRWAKRSVMRDENGRL